MKRLKITIEGKTYEVLVEMMGETNAPTPAPQPVVAAPVVSAPTPVAPAPVPVAAPAPVAAPSADASAPGMVNSPLSGIVVSVDVTLGQQVAKGDQVCVIEAMKMNTYIHAESDGKVAEIFVQKGNAAEEGQPIIRLA